MISSSVKVAVLSTFWERAISWLYILFAIYMFAVSVIFHFGFKDRKLILIVLLLAHLSQRLIGELIVYEGIRRPSVRPSSVCQHFQTASPLKP